MSFFTKKIIIYIVIVALAGAGGFYVLKNKKTKEEIFTVYPGDFSQQVSVSGKVVAAENVDLAFSQNGRVAGIYANVGDRVVVDAVLASMENGDLHADVLQKEALLESASAKLASLEAGTRPEQIAVAESAIASARSAHDQANESIIDGVRNSYTQSDDAVRHRIDQFMSNPRSSAAQLNFTNIDSGLKSDIGRERILIEGMLSQWQKTVDGMNNTSDIGISADMAEKNLLQVRTFLDKVSLAVNSLTASSDYTQAALDGYRSDITTARGNINMALSALTTVRTAEKNAAATLTTVEKDLMLEQAGTIKEDIDAQAALVKSAQADLESAKAKLAKTFVTVPFNGVVTRMDAKVGGIASANTSAISLMSTNMLQVESYVPEIHVPLIRVGNPAVVTLDAYGDNILFAAVVISIDPAETVRDGISTYRTKLQFSVPDSRIKSGMTANVLITTEKKTNVIAVPQGIVVIRDGKKFVSVKEGSGVREREVTTGSVSSLGQIEIIFGLTNGGHVILNAAKK